MFTVEGWQEILSSKVGTVLDDERLAKLDVLLAMPRPEFAAQLQWICRQRAALGDLPPPWYLGIRDGEPMSNADIVLHCQALVAYNSRAKVQRPPELERTTDNGADNENGASVVYGVGVPPTATTLITMDQVAGLLFRVVSRSTMDKKVADRPKAAYGATGTRKALFRYGPLREWVVRHWPNADGFLPKC